MFIQIYDKTYLNKFCTKNCYMFRTTNMAADQILYVSSDNLAADQILYVSSDKFNQLVDITYRISHKIL
jgi:hypothetical protein